MKTKLAIVFSGGGFRGAFQVGALKYLRENWSAFEQGDQMHFDLIAGVSTGSLNGAMLAMNKVDELIALWETIAQNGPSEVYTSPFVATSETGEMKFQLNLEELKKVCGGRLPLDFGLGEMLGLLFKSSKKRNEAIGKMLQKAIAGLAHGENCLRSLADNAPLYKKLLQNLDKDAIWDCRYWCGFVSLDDGTYHSVEHDQFTSNEEFANGVLASSAMPIIWKPVSKINYGTVQATNASDGGIRNISPLGDIVKAIHEDEEPCTYKIVIISCHNNNLPEGNYSESNLAQIALRSLNDIALNEIFRNDLDLFLTVNDLVLQAENQGLTLYHPSGRPLRRFESLLIQPDKGTLADTMSISKDIYCQSVNHGYVKAREAVNAFLNTATPVA